MQNDKNITFNKSINELIVVNTSIQFNSTDFSPAYAVFKNRKKKDMLRTFTVSTDGIIS